MLHGMAEHPQEMSPVMSGNESNAEVTCSPANGNDRKKLALRIIGRARRREEHAGWRR